VSAPHGDRIVAGYLAQLELELGGLPGARRQEILDEIREHIEEARGRIPNESDSDVLNVLDRLGEPAEVASAARPDSAASLPMSVAHGSIWTSGWLDIAAAVLTPVVWPVGVILLWMSSAWSVRDKLIGTLVPPGGYIGVFFGLPLFFLIGNTGGSTCMSGTDAAGNPYHSCTGFMAQPAIVQFAVEALLLIAVVIWVLSPVFTGIYLAIQLRRRSQRQPSGAMAPTQA